MTTITSCKGCGMEFPSKSAVFRHLKETEALCLSPSDRQEYLEFQSMNPKSREKVILLYGYWIPPMLKKSAANGPICNGEDVACVLLQVLEQQQSPDNKSSNELPSSTFKANRSYGHTRSINIAQEDGTSAVTEVIATRLRPLPDRAALLLWIEQMNQALMEHTKKLNSDVEIRLLGRQPMPMGKFNAETDISHRRVEYLLPADFVLPRSLQSGLPSFNEDARSRAAEGEEASDTETPRVSSFQRPTDEILDILTRFKHLMKRLTTHVVDLDVSDAAAVMEKQFHDQKRQRNRDYNSNKKDPSERKKYPAVEPMDGSAGDTSTPDPAPRPSDCNSGKRDRPKKRAESSSAHDKVLRRKRYHNFTPTVMAHEYLAYRRMDRFYHRATFRPCVSSGSIQPPFFALSLSGDMFLTGQVPRVMGLFVALARGVIDDDIVDCVFDESYPHLVPTPPLPSFGHYASDVYYISIEGKVKAILTPRKVDRYENGWNDDETIQNVRAWQSQIRENVARSWLDRGVGEDGSFWAEQEWTETILQPWVARAKEQLNDYRSWKKQNATEDVVSVLSSTETKNEENGALVVPPIGMLKELQSVDATVPALFEKVLFYLRKANESGQWPSTTPKRQLVMVSSISDENETVKPLSSSLSMAHSKAKNNKMTKSSAYVFVEGQGGASGSFSLGAMPGDKCIQPKGNSLFPELMEAAFALEVALCPHRAPSSTIAVNRNAQFRPHTDSGAGSGQSTSLIVGLGTYSGGELVVEGTMMDIRYKAVEFDGWKQRHWTMPFVGERYSLVWFTPKGCEGINFVN